MYTSLTQKFLAHELDPILALLSPATTQVVGMSMSLNEKNREIVLGIW